MGRELVSEEGSRGLTEEDIIHIPGLASHWVRLGNGAKAHYVVSGDTGPAVILCHGGIEGSSGTAGWRFMAPFLGANGFRVYCPDQPGFGWSDTRPEHIRRNPKDHVDFIKAFADALCIDKFFISGNSMGCATAVNVVMAHPDRVLGVAYIAGSLGDVVDPTKRVGGKDSKFSANPAYVGPGFDGTEDSMRVLMEGIIYKPSAIWPELITMRVKAAQRQREGRVAAGLPAVGNLGGGADENIAANLSTNGRLQKLTIPMIYMYGLADVLSPVENGFQQEDAVPNVQFFYPDHCGHQGQTDQLEFFRDGKVSWKTAQWAGVSRRRAINSKFVEEPAGGFPRPIPEKYTDIQSLRSEIGEVAASPA